MNKSSTFSILAAFSPVIQASARFQSNTVNSLQRYLDSTKTSSILAQILYSSSSSIMSELKLCDALDLIKIIDFLIIDDQTLNQHLKSWFDVNKTTNSIQIAQILVYCLINDIYYIGDQQMLKQELIRIMPPLLLSFGQQAAVVLKFLEKYQLISILRDYHPRFTQDDQLIAFAEFLINFTQLSAIDLVDYKPLFNPRYLKIVQDIQFTSNFTWNFKEWMHLESNPFLLANLCNIDNQKRVLFSIKRQQQYLASILKFTSLRFQIKCQKHHEQIPPFLSSCHLPHQADYIYGRLLKDKICRKCDDQKFTMSYSIDYYAQVFLTYIHYKLSHDKEFFSLKEFVKLPKRCIQALFDRKANLAIDQNLKFRVALLLQYDSTQDIDIFEVVNLAAVSPYILYNTLKSDKAYKLILSFAFREFIESQICSDFEKIRQNLQSYGLRKLVDLIFDPEALKKVPLNVLIQEGINSIQKRKCNHHLKIANKQLASALAEVEKEEREQWALEQIPQLYVELLKIFNPSDPEDQEQSERVIYSAPFL